MKTTLPLISFSTIKDVNQASVDVNSSLPQNQAHNPQVMGAKPEVFIQVNQFFSTW
jgi:hypothetical protein